MIRQKEKAFSVVPCTTHFGVRTLTAYVYMHENGELSAIMDGKQCVVSRSKSGNVCVRVRGGHSFPTICDERYSATVTELKKRFKAEFTSISYEAHTRRINVVPYFESDKGIPYMTDRFRLTLKSCEGGSKYVTHLDNEISEIIVTVDSECGLFVDSAADKNRIPLDIDYEMENRPEERLKLEDITDCDFVREAVSGIDASWAMLCLDAYDKEDCVSEKYANVV